MLCGSGNLHVSEWYRKAGNDLDWPGMRLPLFYIFSFTWERVVFFFSPYMFGLRWLFVMHVRRPFGWKVQAREDTPLASLVPKMGHVHGRHTGMCVGSTGGVAEVDWVPWSFIMCWFRLNCICVMCLVAVQNFILVNKIVNDMEKLWNFIGTCKI